MRKSDNRREELLALAVIQTVEGLDDTDWEWVRPGGSPKPDLRVALGDGRTAHVEITSHVDGDELAFRKAVKRLQGEVAAPELSHRWTLAVERGNIRLKDALGGIRRVLRSIERTGRCPAGMLSEAQRRFDPRRYFEDWSPYFTWITLDETRRPSLHVWTKNSIDYWWPDEIAEGWLTGEIPEQMVHPLKCEPSSTGILQIGPGFGLGWDLVGEELKAAVQARIDAKHKKGQLIGEGGEAWLVIVLDADTEAYCQFTYPTTGRAGHWANQTPTILDTLLFHEIDQVWIVAPSGPRTGKVFYVKLPTTCQTPQQVRIPNPAN